MKGTILIIDDNPVDAIVMSKIVENSGYHATSCLNGLEYQSYLDQGLPRVIFLDLEMPKISGFEIVMSIRKNNLLDHVPIVIVSGRNQANDVKKAIQLGANDYIVKPIDALIMQEKVHRFETDSADEFKLIDLSSQQENKASVRRQIEILKVSEFGIEIQSDNPLKVGETIELADLPEKIFGNIRIMARSLVVQELGSKYIIQLTFVGLTEVHRQQIRKSCRQMWVEQTRRIE